MCERIRLLSFGEYILRIVCEEDDIFSDKIPSKSTGLVIWPAAEVLCRYMMAFAKPNFFSDKNVLELGAGLGLCGMLSSLLGSPKVVMTDRSDEVLHLLSININRNFSSSLSLLFFVM